MAVACCALLVALAGTSVAAVTIVIPRNSIGPLQLRDNSVSSAKVQNGSLLRADFRAGQVPAGPRGAKGDRGDKGDKGDTGATGATGAAGAPGVAAPGYVAGVVAASSTSSSETSSTTFTALDNGTLTVTVPTGETDSLLALFSAESSCYGGTSLQRCAVRILVDGNELTPAAASDAFFDNNDLGETATAAFDPKVQNDQASRSIVRYSGNLTAGAHIVKVEYMVTNSAVTLRIDDWALVVQRVKVS